MFRIVRRGVLIGGMLLPFAARAKDSVREMRERLALEDFAELRRYRAANAALIAAGRPVGIVFLGDSITQGWEEHRPGFFREGRVCRGIAGQTTPQLVLRMMQDVVRLRPRYVHILAGINDIAGNTGPMTLQQSADNFEVLTAVARANGIGVLIGSVLPSDGLPWRPGLAVVEPIRATNDWLAAHAARTGATWIDYRIVLADSRGAMRPGLASDGVHPTAAGYDAMAAMAEPVLARLGV